MIFLLPTRQILDVYSVILSSFVLWFSYWFNQNFIMLEVVESEASKGVSSYLSAQSQSLFANLVAQIAMAFSYDSFRLDSAWSNRGPYVKGMMMKFRAGTYFCLLQPVIWHILALPKAQLKWVPLFSVLIIALELIATILIQTKSILLWFKRCYMTARYMLRTYGIQTFLESQWIRLHVPSVLRVFWLTRMAYQVTYLSVLKVTVNSGMDEPRLFQAEDLLDIGKQVLIAGCETTVALLGMTSIVSFFTHYIGLLMAGFIGSQNDEDKNMGTMSAILFFILALQTGLTSLEEDQRLVRLYRNFCLLSTAILHFVHTMVNPMLMNLSASHSGSLMKHARVLAMCTFLIGFPAWFLHALWAQHSVSTWLLAVTAFSIEVIIKVIISLLVYLLFMTDAYHETFWEKLDDYVYYIKSTGNTIEFTFGIFLFGNGAWIMIFESGGAIRAGMMVIHAYFNIWVQAKEGWKVFMKRRTAVNKINSLPMASESELLEHNDVCAICYQELASARITYCKHLFHGVCLRKWLYVQDCCPLCHKLIYKQESPDDSGEENGNDPENNDNNQGPVPNDPQPDNPLAIPLPDQNGHLIMGQVPERNLNNEINAHHHQD